MYHEVDQIGFDRLYLPTKMLRFYVVFWPCQEFVVHCRVKVGVKGWEVVPETKSYSISFPFFLVGKMTIAIIKQSSEQVELLINKDVAWHSHAFLCLVSFLLVPLTLGSGDLGNYCRHFLFSHLYFCFFFFNLSLASWRWFGQLLQPFFLFFLSPALFLSFYLSQHFSCLGFLGDMDNTSWFSIGMNVCPKLCSVFLVFICLSIWHFLVFSLL